MVHVEVAEYAKKLIEERISIGMNAVQVIRGTLNLCVNAVFL